MLENAIIALVVRFFVKKEDMRRDNIGTISKYIINK